MGSGTPGGRPENLKPVKTKVEARERGRNGGIKSGKVRKEKKLMSQIYAAFLESEFNLVIDDKERKITGESLVEHAMRKVLAKSDSASVSLMKEIRESTEGNKLELTGETKEIIIQIIDPKDNEVRNT